MSSKTSAQLVIDLINADNALTLTDTMVSLGAPSTNSNGAISKNTMMVLSAQAGSGYSGNVTVYYDRVNLADIVATGSNNFPLTTQASSSDLLTDFNSRFNTGLQASDIVVEALPAAAGDGTITYSLTANGASPAFIGVTTIILTPADVPLSDAVTVTDLNGLTLGTVTA